MPDVTTVVNHTTGTGSFVVPAGITELIVEVLSGGGGGASTSGLQNGGGGGGSAYASAVLPVTPGETLTYEVGTGGAAGPSANTPGVAGTATTFKRGATTLVSADSGKGGTTGAGGAAGLASASVGDSKNSGSPGDRAGGRHGYGGAGASGGTLTGGAQATTPAGVSGNAPGGGGASGGTGGGLGGAGARGHLRITYTVYADPEVDNYLTVFTAAGGNNWRAPLTGKVLMQAIGGGGGGRTGGYLSSGGGGGGGGAYADKIVDVIKGQWYDITIGAGGAANTAGTDTTISHNGSLLLRAKAGGASPGTSGGPGGSAVDSVGDTRTPGYGGVARPDSSVYNAGQGGAGAQPIGGKGSTYAGQETGTAGEAPGGGGSGGGAGNNGTGGPGAPGGAQIAYIAYMGDLVVGGEKKRILKYQKVIGGAKIETTPYVVKDGVAVQMLGLLEDLDARLMPYPTWLPASDEELFDRATGTYNAGVGAQNLAAALAAGTLSLVNVGDSLTEGFTYLNSLPPYDSTADRLNAYPIRLRAHIAASGEVVAGTGFVRTVGTAGRDPRWTVSGTADNGHYITFDPADTATFTSDLPGTNVSVMFLDTSGSASVSIDNATSGPGFVTQTFTGTNNVLRIDFTGLANTTHTVKVTGITGNAVRLMGADVYNATGVKVNNLGQGGATAAGTGQGAWADTSGGTAGNMLPAYTQAQSFSSRPQAVTILLGANDMGGTAAKNYDAMAAAIESIGMAFDHADTDIILLTCPHTSPAHGNGVWPELYSRMYDVARSRNWAIIDLEWLTGGFESLAGYGYTGDIYGHYNNAGAEYIGGLLARAFLAIE